MKITLIANSSAGLYMFRGMLMRRLLEKGHTLTVMTIFDEDVDKLRDLGIILVEVPIDRRGTNPFKEYSLLKSYIKELKKSQPDMVVTYTIKPNVYGGISCRKLRIPYVANITGLGTAFETSGLLRTIAIILNRFALKRSKMVFFENNENRELFVKEGIVDSDKTHVLSGAGVDLKHFGYQVYPNNNIFKFLFVGRIMKEKGVDELLEAMRKIVAEGIPCSLDVLGTYEENYEEKLALAEKEGWLKYHGSQSDVRPFIGACDCFILPSYHEGMANTNLECAASGRPIITSNIPGCKEAVIENVTGFLCVPKDIGSLLVEMKKMINTKKEKRAEMGKMGRMHMEQIFDKKKVVEETITVIEQCL